MPAMLACKQVMLDCSWVTRFHLGLVCTGFVLATMASQVEVTKLDYIRDCSRCLVEKILPHQESFRC